MKESAPNIWGGVKHKDDAEGGWITINGTHIPVGENGQLQGSVGEKISGKSGSSKSTAHNLIFESHSIKAKNEKDAVSKINKQLKEEGLNGKEEGSFKKIVKDNYYGGYTVTRVRQFKVGEKVKAMSDKSSQGLFRLKPDGNGNYVSESFYPSYNGQD